MNNSAGVGVANSTECRTDAALGAGTGRVDSRRAHLRGPRRGQLAAMGMMLIATWVFIPAPSLHLLAGLTFAVLLAGHLLNGRRGLARAVRTVRGRQLSRRAGQILALLTCAGVMFATGLGLLAGLPLTGLHATSSYLMLGLAGCHFWSRRRAVLAASVPAQIASRSPVRRGRGAPREGCRRPHWMPRSVIHEAYSAGSVG